MFAVVTVVVDTERLGLNVSAPWRRTQGHMFFPWDLQNQNFYLLALLATYVYTYKEFDSGFKLLLMYLHTVKFTGR